MVTHIARVWINLVRLPILLVVVSWTGKIIIFLSAFVPENLVSRDGFGSRVPRQPAHPHTQAESGAYLRDSSRVPRRRPFIYLNRHTPSGQSRVYRVTRWDHTLQIQNLFMAFKRVKLMVMQGHQKNNKNKNKNNVLIVHHLTHGSNNILLHMVGCKYENTTYIVF